MNFTVAVGKELYFPGKYKSNVFFSSIYVLECTQMNPKHIIESCDTRIARKYWTYLVKRFSHSQKSSSSFRFLAKSLLQHTLKLYHNSRCTRLRSKQIITQHTQTHLFPPLWSFTYGKHEQNYFSTLANTSVHLKADKHQQSKHSDTFQKTKMWFEESGEGWKNW